jgi:hypothetical protein
MKASITTFWLLSAGLLTLASPSHASSWKQVGEPTPEEAERATVEVPEESSAVAPDPYRREFGALPALGYSNAYGLGMGVVWTMAKFDPGKNPFAWKISGLVQANLKSTDEGLTIPSQNHELEIDVPGMAGGWLRLIADVNYYVMLDSPYYGFGNDTSVTDWTSDMNADNPAYENLRTYNQVSISEPQHNLLARMTVSDASTTAHKKRLEVLAGYSIHYKNIDIYTNSKLARDAAAGLDLLHGTESHWLLMLKTGLMWDTRDHEFAPTRGTFTQALVDWSPGIQQDLRFGHVQAESAWFQALGTPKLVLAARVRADLFTGKVPFYGATLLGGLSQQHVRGLRFGRYRGDLELMENLELRSKLLDFNIGSQQFNLGLTGFFDAGRVWGPSSEDLGPAASPRASVDPALAADSVHIGIGGGPRIQWGETFLIRCDYGISPTDDTTGFYLTIGHRF